ncbi:hypothetical protein GCM10007161_16460 [Ignatzschineria indica]|nr:hypothetical protein GCM10007161_16460 [Ignatzschineria indica]
MDKIMSNAVLKDREMQVPERDRGIIAHSRPALSENSHSKLVERAFDRCFENNKEGLELLANT